MNWKKTGGIFEIDQKKIKQAELEKEIQQENFWQQNDASKKSKNHNDIKEDINKWEQLKKDINDLDELLQLCKEENDISSLYELEQDLKKIEKKYTNYKKELYFKNDSDKKNTYLIIHSGAGGTEACDWVSMLFRMYLRWVERKNFKSEIIDQQQGDEAGIKSATIHIIGDNVSGLLKSEKGVHRLVRISPFDSNKRRHTSFASVDIIPEIEDSIEVDIQEKDLRIDTYRSSGAGGQHVNMTDSAVRITHIPTGIVVTCQNERSQHKNKSTAMKILRSRLYEYYKKEKEKQSEDREKQKKKIEWGSQIRSYVFHPYIMVKDHRTNTETGNGNAVMDGDIDKFIYSYLEMFS